MTLMLVERDLPFEPLLYLKAYFERRCGAYHERLLNVSEKGQGEDWMFFLRSMISEARGVSHWDKKLFDQRESYRARLREGARINLLAAVNHLFANPMSGIGELARVIGVTFEAAGRMVRRLEDENVLEEITGRRRNRVYAAREVTDVLEGRLV